MRRRSDAKPVGGLQRWAHSRRTKHGGDHTNGVQEISGYDGLYHMRNLRISESMQLSEYLQADAHEHAAADDEAVARWESSFWHRLNHQPHAVYGAGVDGSLCDGSEGEWDLRQLQSLLNKATTDEPMAGINRPMLYGGRERTLFPWHKEDMDLCSINFVHSGMPKVWYSLSSDQGYGLESVGCAARPFPIHSALSAPPMCTQAYARTHACPHVNT